MHIAIAGLIDFNDDGKDHGDELRRSLAQQGIEVDAYVDLKDGKIKGPGITTQTAYLITGETPQFNNEATIRDDDPRYAWKKSIGEKITELSNEAKELGTMIVPFRRFVALVGLKLPKTYNFNQGGIDFDKAPAASMKRPAKDTPKKDDAPAAMEKKEEEKKDDSDK
jgi:hypothetical protein